MNDKTTDLTIKIAVFVIVLSLLFIGFAITGRVTDTGTVNITVISSAAINFTVDNVNWGGGQVDNGQNFANLTTEGVVTNGNWTTVNEGFRLENIGNVNVSLNISSNLDAAGFIGGSGPWFAFKIENNESTSCINNNASVYTNFTGSGTNQRGCFPLRYLDANDYINVEILLTVPYDASGVKGAIVTANATAI